MKNVNDKSTFHDDYKNLILHLLYPNKSDTNDPLLESIIDALKACVYIDVKKKNEEEFYKDHIKPLMQIGTVEIIAMQDGGKKKSRGKRKKSMKRKRKKPKRKVRKTKKGRKGGAKKLTKAQKEKINKAIRFKLSLIPKKTTTLRGIKKFPSYTRRNKTKPKKNKSLKRKPKKK